MSSKPDFSNMKLTSVLKEFLDLNEWTDEIRIGEDGDASLSSTFKINNQGHSFFFEISESAETFRVYMYSPFVVPVARRGEMAIVLNYINTLVSAGRFATSVGDDAAAVQFFTGVDVEGGQLGHKMISSMLDAAINYFDHFGSLIAAVALTKISASQAIEEFREEQEAAEANEAVSVPDEL